jgi:hypothetical protein
MKMKTYILAAVLAVLPLAAQAETATVRSACLPKQGWQMCYTVAETAATATWAMCFTRGAVQQCRGDHVDKKDPNASVSDAIEKTAREIVLGEPQGVTVDTRTGVKVLRGR